MTDSRLPEKDPALASAAGDDPAAQFEILWAQGQPPAVESFLEQAGALTPADLAAVLRVDQRQRWRQGKRVLAETYLGRYRDVRADAEAALDLIFNEFLVREQLGERPGTDEYLGRFPEYATALREQIELHRALETRRLQAGSGPAGSAGLGTPRVTSSAASPPPADLPEWFGRYRILRKLGQGGMATVYLAHDTQLDRPVALKVPRLDRADDPALIERFYREARIAAGFTDPGLCPVYDVGQRDGVHYLTMPILPGVPLTARLEQEGALPERAAAELTWRLARALQVAHEAGVVHRDLKPSNIMVNDALKPVVMDFGLARRALAADPRLTDSGVLLGTPLYLAPEQIGCDPEVLGPGCDIYSLGVILYEMLSGRPPFQGPLHEILRQVLTRDPDPPSRHRPGLDPRLENICLTALAKDPRARFASMQAFAAALEGYLQGGAERTNAARPARPSRTAPAGEPVQAVQRRAAWLALACLGAVAVGLILWLAAWRLKQPGALATAVDALRAGSQWSGHFSFLPPNAGGGDVQLSITERDGEAFAGVYSTEEGQYEWRVEGTVRGEEVRWWFTRVVREREPHQVVGKARVEGQLRGEALDVLYRDEDSAARMSLRRLR